MRVGGVWHWTYIFVWLRIEQHKSIHRPHTGSDPKCQQFIFSHRGCPIDYVPPADILSLEKPAYAISCVSITLLFPATNYLQIMKLWYTARCLLLFPQQLILFLWGISSLHFLIKIEPDGVWLPFYIWVDLSDWRTGLKFQFQFLMSILGIMYNPNAQNSLKSKGI